MPQFPARRSPHPRARRTGVVALGTAVAALVAAGPAYAADLVPVASWEVASGNALAVGGQGRVLVAVSPSGGDGVIRYSSAGRQLGRFGAPGRDAGQLDAPFGLATDAAGNAYVTDISARISIFSASGSVRAATPLGAPVGGPVIGTDVDVDPAGERWVAHTGNGTLPDGVLRFGGDGAGLASFGSAGGGDGQFAQPGGVASDGRGNVYVTDVRNHRVQRFTADGAFVRGWGQLGSGRSQLREPRGIAVDAAGDVYVADHGNARIQHYRPDGRLVASVPLPEVFPYRAAPWDLDFDAAGDLYVLHRRNAAIGAVIALRPVTGAAVRSTALRVAGGRVPVRLRCAAGSACRGTLGIRRGGTTVARGTFRIAAGRTATVRVPVSARGRAVLPRERVHAVTVRVQPARGRTVSTPLTLRR